MGRKKSGTRGRWWTAPPRWSGAAVRWAIARGPEKHRPFWWSVIGATALLVFLVGGAALLTPDCQDEGCPTLATLEEYRPPEPPRVYDRHGELAGQLAGPRRQVVPLDEIAPLVRYGFVAVEDQRFFDHGGVDLVGVGRAAFRNLRAGGVREGASTITMQLVRNVFEADVLDYNRWRRKLTEVRMALALEERLTKSRILELYLNQIYLGDGVWGVETAARHFFGTSISEVTPGQAALIVGLARNPEGYNPRRNPDRARERRAVVLSVFERDGLLTAEEAEAAAAEPIELAPRPEIREQGAYYLAAVDGEIRELFPDPVDRRGLRIHTGYDPALQRAARAALLERIEAVEGGELGLYTHPTPEEREADQPDPVPSPWLQGMVVALDATSGEVRALVGGRDFDLSEFDRARQARRQPGSAFKPFVFAAGLASGVTLADRLETGPVTVQQAGRPPWRPRDAGDGAPLSVRQALARSSNTATVRLGMQIGVPAVIRRARTQGIEATIPDYPSTLLGSAEVVPLELVAAYAPFTNGGHRVEPRIVTRVEAPDGAVLWQPETSEPESVIDPGVAYLVRDAMRDVVDGGGTGWRVRQAGYRGPVAGKTGTTDEARDAWFVGVTPDLVAGVWLGFDEPKTIVPGASGGNLAAPVWGRLMRAYEQEAAPPGRSWTRPTGVIEALVDTSTGHRATRHCPEEVVETELFLVGTDPALQCPRHTAGFFDRVLGGVKELFGIGRDEGS